MYTKYKFKNILHKLCVKSIRTLRSKFGLDLIVICLIWEQISNFENFEELDLKEKHLLWGLNFLRQNPYETDAEIFFKTTRKTYRKRSKQIIALIYIEINTVRIIKLIFTTITYLFFID